MKKVLVITKNILTWVVVVFAVLMMVFTIISVNTLDRNNRNIFGYKFFIVQSDSMAATDFKAGDIVISKNVDVEQLGEGDIITFISQHPDHYGETVTYKIRKVTTDKYGCRAFVTYGTTTNTDDKELATVVIGKYVGRIPNLGQFFVFLKTTPGYILCILTPFLVLIIYQGINCVHLFRKYRKEQVAEMEEEKNKIKEERAENQRLMAELLELKAQLEKKEKDE
jgi:signal peptidase I